MTKHIIVAYKEPITVNLLIKTLLKNYDKSSIILVAPDEETLNVGKKYGVTVLQDEGKGKSAAINFVRKYLIENGTNSDEVLIFIDGDIILKDLRTIELLRSSAKKYGCSYGKPVFLCFKEPYRTWSKFLEKSSDFLKRLNRLYLISGYIWAIKLEYLPILPEHLFAEDSYLTMYLLNIGVKPKYVSKAEYFVIFPSNLKEYVRQRLRTHAGHWQVIKIFEKSSRKLSKDTRYGIYLLFKELLNLRIISFLLNSIQGLLRIFIWIYSRKYIRNRLEEVWVRIESTKL